MHFNIFNIRVMMQKENMSKCLPNNIRILYQQQIFHQHQQFYLSAQYEHITIE